MNTNTKEQPASMIDIAGFLVSPWLWLTIVMIAIGGYKAWNAELEGLAALTPSWFMPGGTIGAALGILASVGLLVRGEHAPIRLATTALVAFTPAVLFVVLDASGMPLAASFKTVLGILFVAGPWIGVIAARMDRQRRSRTA